MTIYFDDDSASRQLAMTLRKAGHDVSITADLGMSGAADPVHLTRAIQDGRLSPTAQCSRLQPASRSRAVHKIADSIN